MPFKPGGGHLPQPYDPKNGEYIDKTPEQILEYEMNRILKMKIDHSYFVGYEPHWPTLGIHDDEYCKIFVECYRHRFNPQPVTSSKANYLLTPQEKDDKSGFLTDLGYSKTRLDILQNDLIKCARFDLSIYNENTTYGLKIYVPIKIRNKFVVSIWIFNNDKNRKLHFVTLREKEKTYEKLFRTWW